MGTWGIQVGCGIHEQGVGDSVPEMKERRSTKRRRACRTNEDKNQECGAQSASQTIERELHTDASHPPCATNASRDETEPAIPGDRRVS